MTADAEPCNSIYLHGAPGMRGGGIPGHRAADRHHPLRIDDELPDGKVARVTSSSSSGVLITRANQPWVQPLWQIRVLSPALSAPPTLADSFHGNYLPGPVPSNASIGILRVSFLGNKSGGAPQPTPPPVQVFRQPSPAAAAGSFLRARWRATAAASRSSTFIEVAQSMQPSVMLWP